MSGGQDVELSYADKQAISKGSYEQSRLDLYSTPGLRKGVLTHPPESEVPWYEYPVPTHYKVFDGQWQRYDPAQRPTIYIALKYSDGSIRSDDDWGTMQASYRPKPWHPCHICRNHVDCQKAKLCLNSQITTKESRDEATDFTLAGALASKSDV